jgi:hypothetical protein
MIWVKPVAAESSEVEDFATGLSQTNDWRIEARGSNGVHSGKSRRWLSPNLEAHSLIGVSNAFTLSPWKPARCFRIVCVRCFRVRIIGSHCTMCSPVHNLVDLRPGPCLSTHWRESRGRIGHISLPARSPRRRYSHSLKAVAEWTLRLARQVAGRRAIETTPNHTLILLIFGTSPRPALLWPSSSNSETLCGFAVTTRTDTTLVSARPRRRAGRGKR